jgi:hypothetical protein
VGARQTGLGGNGLAESNQRGGLAMSGLVSLVGPWAASGCSGWSGGALAFDTFTVQHPCLVVAEELKGEKVEASPEPVSIEPTNPIQN